LLGHWFLSNKLFFIVLKGIEVAVDVRKGNIGLVFDSEVMHVSSIVRNTSDRDPVLDFLTSTVVGTVVHINGAIAVSWELHVEGPHVGIVEELFKVGNLIFHPKFSLVGKTIDLENWVHDIGDDVFNSHVRFG